MQWKTTVLTSLSSLTSEPRWSWITVDGTCLARGICPPMKSSSERRRMSSRSSGSVGPDGLTPDVDDGDCEVSARPRPGTARLTVVALADQVGDAFGRRVGIQSAHRRSGME